MNVSQHDLLPWSLARYHNLFAAIGVVLAPEVQVGCMRKIRIRPPFTGLRLFEGLIILLETSRMKKGCLSKEEWRLVKFCLIISRKMGGGVI